MRRTFVAAAVLAVLAAGPAFAASPFPTAAKATSPKFEEDAALKAAIAGDWRSAAHKARDAQRRPFESLTFWGLRPGATVVEIGPGGEAWWSEILAPYAASTGGTYVAALGDRANPNLTPEQKAATEKSHADFKARFSDPRFGNVVTADFGMVNGLGVQPGSADMILVARAFHNWAAREGLVERYMAEWFKALKPGGVLAVEQHRAPEGYDPVKTNTGYVPESWVIAKAKGAGFALDARSELNANARDDRDHPFGVWTLAPVRQSTPRPGNPIDRATPLTEAERAEFDAIGESDRMTLRFRKP